MIDTAKIKANILSCAFKGMLVDFNVEKSNEALDELHKENKKYVPVKEDEFLTEVPSRWQWSRLGYVTNNHGQKEPQEDFCYIDVGTLDNINHCLAKKENLVNKEEAPSRARKIVEQGDVLYSTVRPYLHNICIINKDFSRMPVASTAFCVMAVEEKVLINKYLFYWLLSPEFDKFSNGNPSKGTLYPAIGEKDLLNGVIPIPDIEEQKLIVEKLDSAFEHLDKLNRLQILYTSDLEVLKSKIIDAGIQGKLTEQLPEDGTAEELSKNHIDDIINQEEKILDIPSNWSWIKLGWAMEIERGGSPRPIKAFVTDADDGINWIKIGDVAKDGKYIYQTKEKIKPEGEQKSRKVYPGDFLLTNSMSFGRPYISKIEGCIHDGWLLLRNTNELFDLDYLYWLLSSGYAFKQFSKKAAGATVDNLNKDKVASAVIPLPPLSEQKRIANVLEEIMNKL